MGYMHQKANDTIRKLGMITTGEKSIAFISGTIFGRAYIHRESDCELRIQT